ncbi:hypothetical protein [Bradyrhizobium diazoefficiens]
MQYSDLPPAPYLYERVSAFAFISDRNDEDSWIGGIFPDAPTGPFSETWRLRRSPAGWTPRSIVVDNPIRMKAGREIWRLPKVLGKVDIGFEEAHRITTVSQELTCSLTFRRSGEKQKRRFSGTFELILPGGRRAELRFQPVETAFRASTGEGRCGYLFEFGGAAQLTGPMALVDVA